MKVLIIGLGSIALKHIKALNKVVPGCEIYALRSSATAGAVAGVINLFSWEEAFNAGPFNFAVISNPTSEHGSTIEKLIPFKCPLFIEKPVLNSLQHAEYLEKLLQENNILTYVACNLRFHPCLEFIKKYLEDPGIYIQEVNAYGGSYLPDWRPGADFRKIYSANADMGGGVHLDLIHELDYLLWMLGIPGQYQAFFKSRSALNIDAYDYAHYVLDYPNFNAMVTLNYYRRIPRRTLEILTETDVIEVDLLKMTVMKNKEIIFNPEFNIYDTYTKQIEFFIESIEKGFVPMNTFADAVQTLKITLG